MTESCFIKAFLLATAISSVLGQGASKCKIDTDVGFILDSSGSIKNQYVNEKNFLNNIAASFGIGTGKSRASVVTFSYFSELSIKFNDFDNLADFQAAVMKIPLMGYTTFMDRALRLAQREMFLAKNGHVDGRARLVIMLTDGEQTTDGGKYEEPSDVVKEMRTKFGINVIVIGMGRRIKKKSVIKIAGGAQYAFSTKGFAKLATPEFLSSVKATACDAAEESLGLEYLPVTTPAPTEVCPDTDMDYSGKDVKLDLNVATWSDCNLKCKQNAECKYFTFVLESGCCYHKSEKGTPTKTTGLISGSRNCPI